MKVNVIHIVLSASERKLLEKAMSKTDRTARGAPVLPEEWCKIAVLQTARTLLGDLERMEKGL